MKYAIIAGLVTVAVATPQWEAIPSKKADPTTSTWNEWENVSKTTTTTSAWTEWDPVKPEPTKDADWEEWHKNPSYTTTVVTAITTYCSEPTKIVHHGKTWDITSATTLTITECPCTISVPVYTKTSTSCAPKATDDDWENYPLGCKNGKDKNGKDCKIPADAATTWANYAAPSSVAADDWANYPLGCKNGKDKEGKPCTIPADAATTWANYVAPSAASSTWAAWQSASVPVAASSTSSWGQWASSTGPAIAKWTGAANKVNVGAGLAGVAGIAALLL